MTRHTNLVLHGGLRDLLQKEANAIPLSLPLKRFAEVCQVDDPSMAMRIVTRRLLTQVRPNDSSGPISIESLCRLSKITLAGSERVTSSVDHGWAGYFRNSSHVGEIVFHRDSAVIRVPCHLDFSAARLSIAHELGHFLIHAQGRDRVTTRLPSTDDEEALAEYGARLLLMPADDLKIQQSGNLAAAALTVSRSMRTTLHSAVSRLADPDVEFSPIRGAILWRMSEHVSSKCPIEQRLSPYWHLCSPAYVPVRRCKARKGSIIAMAAAARNGGTGTAVEDVRIGTFTGVFRIDVVAWGCISEGTRIVLSTFTDLDRSDSDYSPAASNFQETAQMALV